MRRLKLIAFLIGLVPLLIEAQGRVTYFTATNLKDSVRLNLTVSAGPGCAGWQVMHGNDSVNLTPIYVYGGICGNTSYAESYKYLDMTPSKSTSNYYQIYIPPNDYSKILKVDLATNFSNLLVFPQPVQDYLNISISNKLNFTYEMHIYDRYGRKKGFTSGSAADKISLNVSSFDAGVFVFYILYGSGHIY
jgi:hypothetical protein